jgi:hypothetical protein
VNNVEEHSEPPHGLVLMPRDLTAAEIAAAPILHSLDELVIDDLTDDEYMALERALAERALSSTRVCSVDR